MSTLKVTTLQDTAGGNSSTSEEIYSGRAKAWVNFNGTGTVAIRAQFNVSSITDNGSGNYAVNFTTAMVDANYAMVAMCEPSVVPSVGASFYTVVGGGSATAFTRTTSSAQIKTAYVTSLSGASTPWDSQGTHVAIFR